MVSEEIEIESDDDELDFLDDEYDEQEKWKLRVVVEPFYIPLKGCLASTLGNKFLFRSKDDKRTLLRVWRLPRVIYLDNGSTVIDEFMMLFLI